MVRDTTTVEADRSVFFTSDRVAVKATMRVGFGFVQSAVRGQGRCRVSSPGTVTVEVCHGWAVTVDGEQVTGGTFVDVPAEQAAAWVAKGWVALADPVPTKPRRQRR